jgi:hypothetical protein
MMVSFVEEARMSNIISNENEPDINNKQFTYPYLQAHDVKQLDKYNKYLAQDSVPDNRFKNPKNLFHELNSKDRVWLNIARKNLSECV